MDAGNTRLKWAVVPHADSGQPPPIPVEFGALRCGEPLELEAWCAGYHVVSAELAGSNTIERLRIEQQWPTGAPPLTTWSDRSRFPVQLDVDSPERVGTDRLLNAVAANRLRQAHQGAIVVDSGTATTIDLISSNGVFCGGAILPGLLLSARALHEYTSVLPFVPPPLSGDSGTRLCRSEYRISHHQRSLLGTCRGRQWIDRSIFSRFTAGRRRSARLAHRWSRSMAGGLDRTSRPTLPPSGFPGIPRAGGRSVGAGRSKGMRDGVELRRGVTGAVGEQCSLLRTDELVGVEIERAKLIGRPQKLSSRNIAVIIAIHSLKPDRAIGHHGAGEPGDGITATTPCGMTPGKSGWPRSNVN